MFKFCVNIFAAVSTATVLASAAHAEEVRVYNWSDYIDESLLEQFTESTGIKVIYDVFDSNEVLETKLLAGSTGYDVVVPSGSFMARQIQAGIGVVLASLITKRSMINQRKQEQLAGK